MAVLAGIIPGLAIIAEHPTQATGHLEVGTAGVPGIGNHHLTWRIGASCRLQSDIENILTVEDPRCTWSITEPVHEV
jgi:hypothetical protein